MQYSIHENGWTILIEDFDIKDATQEDVNQIARLAASHTCVVIKNQKLSVADELRIGNMFKDPEPLFKVNDETFNQCAADLTVDPTGIICRVSGELNEHGKPGIAGHVDEMRWHNNHPYRADRRPLVWLYGVRGTVGSRTSWNNNILSYQDLSDDMKETLSSLKSVYIGGIRHTEEFAQSDQFDTTKFVRHDFTPNLVYTNIANKTGLYFSLYQLEKFVGMTREESLEIAEPLHEHTIQEKYCYHHDWADGDLVISEQWLGIHKRWKFEQIQTRLLHRMVFDFPAQDYSIN